MTSVRKRNEETRPDLSWADNGGTADLAGLRICANRLLYRDGLPVALLAGRAVQFLEPLDPAGEWQARKALLRSAARGTLVDLA